MNIRDFHTRLKFAPAVAAAVALVVGSAVSYANLASCFDLVVAGTVFTT